MIKGNPWVWIVVVDPGRHEQFLGQHDQERSVSFLPAFFEKEEAVKGLDRLTRDEGHTYEVQAIRYQDLARNARAGGFVIFLLDGDGKVLEKVGI